MARAALGVGGALMAHANRGRWLEDLLARVHARYALAGARCLRLHPEMRPITVRGHAGPVYVPVEGGGGVADYLVIADGVSWSVDAKSTTEARWSLDNLHITQAAAFDRWIAPVGCAFEAGCVVALHGSAADVWWVPWPALRPRWRAYLAARGSTPRGVPVARGLASLSADDLDEIGRSCPGGDWLPAAQSLLTRSCPDAF